MRVVSSCRLRFDAPVRKASIMNESRCSSGAVAYRLPGMATTLKRLPIGSAAKASTAPLSAVMTTSVGLTWLSGAICSCAISQAASACMVTLPLRASELSALASRQTYHDRRADGLHSYLSLSPPRQCTLEAVSDPRERRRTRSWEPSELGRGRARAKARPRAPGLRRWV